MYFFSLIPSFSRVQNSWWTKIDRWQDFGHFAFVLLENVEKINLVLNTILVSLALYSCFEIRCCIGSHLICKFSIYISVSCTRVSILLVPIFSIFFSQTGNWMAKLSKNFMSLCIKMFRMLNGFKNFSEIYFETVNNFYVPEILYKT